MARSTSNFESVFITPLQKKAQKLLEDLKSVVDATYDEYFQFCEMRIREMFNTSISAFYSDYHPLVYESQGRMYNLLRIDRDKDHLGYDFDPTVLTFRNGYTDASGETGLYDQAFRKGWHGGAGSGAGHPSQGTPYWRTPIPYYDKWGDRAAVSKSPLLAFNEKMDAFNSSEAKQQFEMIYGKNLKEKLVRW